MFLVILFMFGVLIGVLLCVLTTSSEVEDIFNNAYKLGYEKGRQAEKVNVEEIIRKFAECNEECKEKFYYNQGCKACFWNTIIEKIKEDAEC